MTPATPMHESQPAAKPLVTIGMPVFNNARTLQTAIDSVRAQTFDGWRLIISDDGSLDAGHQIAAAAAAEDTRISLVRQAERLGFMNFRVPLDQAQTPYFVWLAADDHWHPDFLAETVRALNAAPAALSALPQAAFIGPAGRPIPNLEFLKGDASGRIRRYLAHPGGTRMYGLMRTAQLRAAFPPRPFHAYDWYLMVALLGQGPQLSLPQTLLFREETPWWRYAADYAAKAPSGVLRSFPILEMSLQLIRDGRIPRGALPALAMLNLHKHEEFLAVAEPGKWRRRRWLYRRMGLSIVSSPAKQVELATRQRSRNGFGQPDPRMPAAGVTLPRVTAILTFRNAAQTLAAALDHLGAMGCDVIAIDHGSTDESRAIAEARIGTFLRQIIDEAWTGTFNLNRQLQIKRQIIATLPPGWVLYADADEFVDPPAGRSLADCLARADADGRIAFRCNEHLFLPQFEDEEHDPETFQQTMTACVRMLERDAKQRLFRTDADLDLWMRTGGHTVTRDPALLAATDLALRHYPGLSLDHLRSQYCALVVAPDDCARLWHGNRMAARSFDVVEPDPKLFQGDVAAEVRTFPFFAARTDEVPAALPIGVNLYLVGAGAGDDIKRLVRTVLPGLRIATVAPRSLAQMTRTVPVLHVLSHPASLQGHGVQRSMERSRATAWTVDIAVTRQWAADRNAIYAEIRAEDAVGSPGHLRGVLARLWHPPLLRGTSGFIGPEAPVIERAPWGNPVRSITVGMAADLGYR